jgi:hypothetical protein
MDRQSALVEHSLMYMFSPVYCEHEIYGFLFEISAIESIDLELRQVAT